MNTSSTASDTVRSGRHPHAVNPDRVWRYWVLDLDGCRYARVLVTEAPPPADRTAADGASPWSGGVWHPFVECHLLASHWLVVVLPDPAEPLFIRLLADNTRSLSVEQVFSGSRAGRQWVADYEPGATCVLIEDHTSNPTIGD